MLKDIMFFNGNLNITDTSFLKYLPIVPDDEKMSDKDKKKYNDGQRKLANYLYSMLPEGMEMTDGKDVQNLFTKILQEALSPFSKEEEDGDRVKDYMILPFIKDSFKEDLSWLLDQEETVKVKYLPLFLHFYACYAVT